MPLRSLSTTKLLVFNNKVYTHFLPDKINSKVFNQSENEMNSELREPITETNYAPPRPLWYHATYCRKDKQARTWSENHQQVQIRIGYQWSTLVM